MPLKIPRVALLAVVATLSGFLATVVLPAADPAVRLAPQPPALDMVQARGAAIYVRENCMACHTQQVRVVESEIGMIAQPGDIGAAVGPQRYRGQNPAVLGSRRVGPDLTHVGARIEQADELIALLRDPTRRTPGARMPSYAHLSEDELRALAAYLLSLR
jgi:cytochrome c oxidase cbb3-type subunit 2